MKLTIIHQSCLVFPKRNRLLVPSDFQRVFKRGRKQRGALFTIVCCANGEHYARLGLAIAKKHVPLSVERNRVRRIIRETFRHFQSALKGKDIVVIAQRALPEISNMALKEDLNQQWQYLAGSSKIF